MADLNVALILKFIDQATRPARAAMGQVEEMSARARKFGAEQVAASRERIALERQSAAARLGEAAGLAAQGWAMQRALQPAIEFEAKMAEVGKVVDFSASDGLQLLGRDIQNLVTDGGLPMVADGIADIVAAAAGANLVDKALPDAEKREELVAFAEAAAKMGVAFDMSADAAGQAMATWRSALGLTQAEAVSLGDAVNFLSNNMNASAANLTEIIQKTGSVAKGAGLANDEVAALSAAFLAGGANADVAATTLKNFTSALTKGEAATKQQSDVLDKLGFGAEDLAKRMQVDAKGAIVDVLDALRGLEDYERPAAISMLFGEESRGAITPLIENADLLKGAFELVGDKAAYAGAMTREYEGIAGTTQSRLSIMSNRMTELSVVMGTSLLPALIGLTEAVTPLVEAFGNFAAAHPHLIQGAAMLFAGLWSLRVVSLLLGSAWSTVQIGISVFNLALGGLSWAAGAAGSAITGLGRAFMIAGRFLLANPIIAVIAAIAGLAYVIYENWDGVVAFFQQKIDAVRAAFDEGLLQGVLKTLSEFNPFRLILEGAVNLIEYLTGWDLSFVTDKIKAVFDFSLFDLGVRLLQSAWDGMSSILGPMVSAISARISAIVPDWLLRAWTWVRGGGDEAEGPPAPGRALGGPVRAGQVYRWMEEGEEMFSPRVDGSVVSTRELRALRAGGGRGGGSVTVGDIVINAAPGMSAEDVARAVRREIERLGRSRGAELHDGGAYAA